MIQRIAPSTSRIQGLATLLQAPAQAQKETRSAQGPAQMPAPDPVVQLEVERERVLQAARNEGYAQGVAEAEVEVQTRVAGAELKALEALDRERTRLAETNERLVGLLEALPAAVDELESRLEQVVIEATFASVTRLLGNAAVEDKLIAQVSRQALEEYQQRPVVVRVSPLTGHGAPELDAISGVSVEVDARLLPGQCRLETHKGVYDAGLDVRLEALKRALLDAVRAGATTP
ncbi:FliH/SctL family protein [Marilutibacter alkalisoli]|uniref:Uncharacterized protein n=1 Tax=Marilutibacter alkalisoli TaxID=2591633 RepID=A0A514BS49_9GAMM|nr:FliH/SctL family protein [Lysobacter alkalisoli]QDH70145.1 hypothetical protein FKV23_08590 [Lysobacter alkalisoli]